MTFCLLYLRKWRDLDSSYKTFFLLALLNYLCLLALAVEPLFEQSWRQLLESKTHTVLMRTMAFVVIIVFQNVHLFFGVFSDNVYELYATMVTQAIAFALIVFRSSTLLYQFHELDAYSLVLFVYGLASALLYASFAFPLYRASTWSVFMKAGANEELTMKYKKYLFLLVLLKLDCMGCMINAIVFEVGKNMPLVVSVVLTDVGYCLLGKMAYSRESIVLLPSFWILSLIHPIFLSFGLYYLSQRSQSSLALVQLSKLTSSEYDVIVFNFLFVITSIYCMVMRLLLVVQSVVVYNYFGEGISMLEKKNAKSYWIRTSTEEAVDSAEEEEEEEERER